MNINRRALKELIFIYEIAPLEHNFTDETRSILKDYSKSLQKKLDKMEKEELLKVKI